jgi:hypothetical protein
MPITSKIAAPATKITVCSTSLRTTVRSSHIPEQAELNHKDLARGGAAVVPVYMTARRPPITLAMRESEV